MFGYADDVNGGNKSLLTLKASGESHDDLLAQLDDGHIHYIFVRIGTGDEMSKRSKFVLIYWVGEKVKPMRKGSVSTHKSFVKEVVTDYALELTATEPSDLAHELLVGKLNKLSVSYGANTS